MKFNLFSRKVHYWLSIAVALPLLVVIVTGLMLQTKKQITWVQPAEQRGKGKVPAISMEQILAAATTVAEAEIQSWDDINRMDVRPSRGILKIFAKNHWEIQLDSETGAVLQKEYRRSDIIESLHDGSFFGEFVKLGVFLPSAVVLFFLWLTGIYLFILPIWVKRKRKFARE